MILDWEISLRSSITLELQTPKDLAEIRGYYQGSSLKTMKKQEHDL